MNLTDIPVKMTVRFAATPDAGASRVVPVTTATPGAADYQHGWRTINLTPVSLGGIPPFGQDFNGLMNVVTAWLQWAQVGGPITYDSAFQALITGYPNGSLVGSATTTGRKWSSTVDANVTNPDTGGAGWISLTPRFYTYAGNPNTHVAGSTGGTNFPPDMLWDTTNGLWWTCTTTGNAAGAVWGLVGSSTGGNPAYWCGTSTGSANAQTIAPPAALQFFPTGTAVAFTAGFTNTGATNITVTGFGTFAVRKDSPAGPVALTGGEIVTGNIVNVRYDGTFLQLIDTALGTAALANASSGTGVVAAVSGATVVGHLAQFSDTAGTVTEGPIPSSATGTLAAVSGVIVAGHLAGFSDTAGTLVDAGNPLVAAGGLPVNTSQNVLPGTYYVDTSAGAITLTLSAALTGAYTFIDSANAWGTNNLTIAGNGNNIGNVSTNVAASFLANASDYQFSMRAAAGYWRLV